MLGLIRARKTLFIISLIIFADINYFHCLKIFELLKGTDDGAKNIFGGYSSKRMKVSGHSFFACFYIVPCHLFLGLAGNHQVI